MASFSSTSTARAEPSIPHSAPPTSPETISHATNSETSEMYHFDQLKAYPFSSDLEFRNGLAIVLGHPGTPATTEEVSREDDLVLQAKCFYFSRKENLTPPLNFSAYKTWLRSISAPSQSLSSSNRAIGRESPLQNVPTPTVATASSSSQPDSVSKQSSTTGPEPAYPSSFSHIVELITTGQPVPGIQQIPETVLTGQETPSTAERRRKPWEKDLKNETVPQN